MKPTRILLMVVRLAAAIVPFAVSSCYVTPPSVSFYPPPRPVGITNRLSPNFYARRATPPGSVSYNNQNPYGGSQQPSYGSPPPPYPYDPNAVNGNQYGGNPPPGYGSNPPPYSQNAGNPNGGNPNGDPYGNGSGGSIGSGPPPPPAPPVAPSQVTCAQGYVWREASSTDFVCVTPDARAQAAYDNSQASARSAGGGDYGPDTCVQGYVWREAFAGDHVCVTPQTRGQTASDNSLADSRQGGSSSYYRKLWIMQA